MDKYAEIDQIGKRIMNDLIAIQVLAVAIDDPNLARFIDSHQQIASQVVDSIRHECQRKMYEQTQAATGGGEGQG